MLSESYHVASQIYEIQKKKKKEMEVNFKK